MQDRSFNDATNELPLMGIAPVLPFYDLNLAGAQAVPSPDQIAHAPSPPEINHPTFTGPDMHIPPLAPYDLTGPAIDLHTAFTSDPAPEPYDHPYGLDMYPPQAQASDPFLVDPLLDDRADNMDVKRAMTEPDPLLPDLQHPDLTPQARMLQRPGDLDPSALQTMHMSATYQQLNDKTYPAVFMDQGGTNNSRSRHMDLLMRGLDAEAGSI